MKWEDPPDSGNRWRGPAYAKEAADLKAHPLQWGIVRSYPADHAHDYKARSTAHEIKKGKYIAFRPAGAFDAVSRKGVDDDGKEVVNVYARYLGEPE